MEETKRSWKFWVGYLSAIVAAITLIVVVFSMPVEAHAAETGTKLTAATVDKSSPTVLTTQSSAKKTTTAAKATKVTNPYTDVVSGKTVTKSSYNAVKYVKTHKGFNGVVTGKRYYPTKTFTQAQFTKILRNMYGNKVTLSKSKAAVTGKYACDQMTKVAKNVYGVKIKWKSGAGNAKLTRTAVATYIKTFATWNNGLFKPKA